MQSWWRGVLGVGVVALALGAGSSGCGGGGGKGTADGGTPPGCHNSLECSLGKVCDSAIAQCVDCVTAADCRVRTLNFQAQGSGVVVPVDYWIDDLQFY